MITYRDLLIESELRLSEMARAREARLIRQFVASGNGSAKGYRRWMHSLGTQLISWGSSLQSRYPSRPVEAGAWRPNGTW
jgi:hypothetical protein